MNPMKNRITFSSKIVARSIKSLVFTEAFLRLRNL